MKLQTIFAICVMFICFIAFTACNRGAKQSTAGNEVQSQTIDTEENFSAGFDDSYLENELWFVAGDTGLKVTYASQGILNQYENYVTFIEENVPAEDKIIFTSTRAIDLEYLAIRMEYRETKGDFVLIEEASIASSIVRPDTPFVVNWRGIGSFPHRAVAFYDRNEVKRYFTISGNDSGEGAPILLSERQAGSQFEYEELRLGSSVSGVVGGDWKENYNIKSSEEGFITFYIESEVEIWLEVYNGEQYITTSIDDNGKYSSKVEIASQPNIVYHLIVRSYIRDVKEAAFRITAAFSRYAG